MAVIKGSRSECTALGIFLNPAASLWGALYDRLPRSWGIVRSGVAPDHPGKSSLPTVRLTVLLINERVRFIGNIEIGRDISEKNFLRRMAR